MMNAGERKEFYELLHALCENQISDQQYERLDTVLSNNRWACEIYVDMRNIWSDLKYFQASLYSRNSESYPVERDLMSGTTVLTDSAIWEALSREENESPTLIISKEPEKVLIQKVERDKIFKGVNRTSLITILASIAAIIMFMLFIRYTPVSTGKEVATVSDVFNAKWADDYLSLHIGSRLMDTDPPFMLREGYAELLFDNNVRIVFEAPAEFQILTSDQIKLNYGRVYSTVSEQAYGFTVCTPNSKIIDLGTEFGVQADLYGNVELHVIKGKTKLLSRASGQKIDHEILAGSASSLNERSGKLRLVPCDDQLFIRQINSKNGLIWRGQRTIDLADIVGGGRGFGMGFRGSYLDAGNGEWIRLSGLTGGREKPAKKADVQYNPVRSNPFVDGIFVPNGVNGPMVVSSKGDVFEDVPLTSGEYWYGAIAWNADTGRPVKLDGVLYGTSENPAILMHSNVGITFDLQELRESLEGRLISEFSCTYGISDAYANKNIPPHADFWVLLDGKVKFVKNDVMPFEAGVIQIPISSTDRYLTLITTEGSDNGLAIEQGKGAIFNDWCVWGVPTLIIE